MTLDARILSLIEMAPAGLSDGQLLWRLRSAGVRYDASELLEALDRLAQSGQARVERGRWFTTRLSMPGARPGTEPGAGRRPAPANALSGDRLHAAPATLAAAAPPEPEAPMEGGEGGQAEPAALLRYYAATQRRDPRGSVAAFPDQHGTKWHLFDAYGPWWDGRAASIPAGRLQPGFRQALAEAGGTGSAAAGWPIGVFRDSTGTICLPMLLLPVDWRLEDDRLIFRADRVQPALNPAVVRHIRRLTGLGEEALFRALDSGEEDADLAAAGRRLMHLLARIGGGGLAPGTPASEVLLKGEGLRNAAALFLPDEASFTRRLAQDLDRMAEWSTERLARTALAGFLPLGQKAEPTRLADPVEVKPLTDRQFAAADAALSGAPVAIQGPPGTGKSEVIVSLILSALASGRSVLFAARNHRALDEVEGRLAHLLPDSNIMVRTRDAAGELDTNFFDALSALTEAGASTPDQAQAAADRRHILTEGAGHCASQRRLLAERVGVHLRLADALDRREALSQTRAAAGLAPPKTLGPAPCAVSSTRLLRLSGQRRDLLAPLPENARLDQIHRHIAALEKRLKGLPAPDETPAPDPVPHLAALAAAISAPDADTRNHLLARKAEIDFQPGRARLPHLTAEDARHVLRHRPIWLSSTLSVPARIPLMPALFDLAIFDEASQCDIASALAVMVRARSAVIVGDPEQLSFIPSLGKEQEHALMDAAGLPRAGRALWAQSQNSLFDLARHRLPADAMHLLPDQFRSAPAIVDYTSEVFYAGRLQARRTDDSFQVPTGWRPGLHWQDVCGPCGREDGGNINRSEAEWIAQRLAELAREEHFDGSVGVVSPFNAQVGLIRRLAEAALPEADRRRLKLIIDTVDGWQGGEADVIFLSLAVGQGAAQSAIEFLRRDRRRFNVAVSRARAVAVVVGDLKWAQNSGIAHLEILARRVSGMEPVDGPIRGFDSLWERRVYTALKSRGLDPVPQYPVGRRRLDFALFHNDVKLDLEVDGRKWHTGAGGERKTPDRLRDQQLIGSGWKVRRFWVDELARDMEGCLDLVERDLGRRD